MPIYRVTNRLTYTQPGSPGVNIMHIRTVSDALSEIQAGVDAIHAFYEALEFVLATSTQVDVAEQVIRDPLGERTLVDVDGGTPVMAEPQSAVAPALLSIVCSWRTSTATRSGRGRTFIGPLTRGASNNSGSMDSAIRTTVLEAAQDLISLSTAASGWSLGVLSVKESLLRDVVGVTIGTEMSYLSSRRD